ncbi:MAG: hypothetical protein ABJ275_02110 [Maricaulaceae bacterium]
MSWKTKIQILDIDSGVRLEARCRTCSYVWYEKPCAYFHKSHIRQLYLDEFETRLRCKQWGCKGAITIAMTNESETEGFQGGLA